MTDLRIRPRPGRRVLLPAGGTTLDGLVIAPGGLLPAEGAVVARSPFVLRRLEDEDVELIEERAAPRRRTPAKSAAPEPHAAEPGDAP